MAVELSSHALHQSRAAGMEIDVGVITNITQDHLDFHGDMPTYAAAKSKIAGLIKRGGMLVLNADDPLSGRIFEQLVDDVRILTFGCHAEADITGEILESNSEGTRFRLWQGIRKIECTTPLVGAHNVSNCLAAASAALHLGLSIEEIALGLEDCTSVPGRLQRVGQGHACEAYVDYAHTDDSIARSLAAVRQIVSGELTIVFGAGGERDASKRPLMAQAALAADRIVVTSDNPRGEDPRKIIEDILAGFPVEAPPIIVEPNRRLAIETALAGAASGGAVIVAGRGHEKTQHVGSERIPFDDVQVCQEILAAMQCEPCGPGPHWQQELSLSQSWNQSDAGDLIR